MENIVKIDQDTLDLQNHLKQQLVSIIMNENTFIRNVNYTDPDGTNSGLEIKYMTADKVLLTDEKSDV